MASKHVYCSKPFIADFSHDDYITYMNVEQLVERCENKKYKITKFRTIGIIESFNGKFYIKDINRKPAASKIQVSLAFIKSPLHSTILPFTVQLFGTLQWKKRPVIFAQLIQVLSNATAVRLNDVMLKISQAHKANEGTVL